MHAICLCTLAEPRAKLLRGTDIDMQQLCLSPNISLSPCSLSPATPATATAATAAAAGAAAAAAAAAAEGVSRCRV